jgi:hypothetical protein
MTWVGKSTYHIINDRVEERHRVLLHEFKLSGDCEDIEIYMAEPIYNWQQTEIGKWCMENATDLSYQSQIEHHSISYRVAITGTLTPKQLTYFLLKKG